MPADPGESNVRNLTPRRILGLTLGFELGLGAVAIALALLFGLRPWLDLEWHRSLPLIAVAATFPMTGMILLVARSRQTWAVKVRRRVDETLLPVFAGLRWWAIGLISLAAGLGEELLFRGVLQSSLVNVTGSTAAVFLTALVFGLAHALTPAYLILTTLAGLYLGGLYVATDNLLLPILVHFFYDWIAISWLLSRGAFKD